MMVVFCSAIPNATAITIKKSREFVKRLAVSVRDVVRPSNGEAAITIKHINPGEMTFVDMNQTTLSIRPMALIPSDDRRPNPGRR